MTRSLLVVDDSATIRHMLLVAFSAAGWQVQTAPDVPTARKTKRDGGFDVILTDLHMPGESGCDLLRWVALNYPNTRTVLMSAEGSGCEDCPFQPRCPFVKKPFDLPQLIATINHLWACPPF